MPPRTREQDKIKSLYLEFGGRVPDFICFDVIIGSRYLIIGSRLFGGLESVTLGLAVTRLVAKQRADHTPETI